MALFSAGFIFYTNSFLLKRRKKELGLYSVLGMEKKHISTVLSLESIYSGIVSIGIGILLGILFSKLMFALLLRIIDLDTTLRLAIAIRPIVVTILFFSLLFGLLLFYNYLQIKRTNPIELIQGGLKGEREPKGNWFLGLIGILSLGTGYYQALAITDPLDELMLAFIAVILVIIGTYLLFTTGSILFIKGLRKNKPFYYQKNNFISVSNMLYRMKQNATGLANIAVLSTAVILILATTISLYSGLEDILDKGFPKDVVTSYVYENQNTEQIEQIVQENATNNHVTIKDPLSFYDLSIPTSVKGNRIQAVDMESENFFGKTDVLTIVLLPDYNKTYGKNVQLDKGEILLTQNKKIGDSEKITILEKEYRIKDRVSLEKMNLESRTQSIQVVVADMEELETIAFLSNETQGQAESFGTHSIYYNYRFDLEGSLENKLSFGSSLRDALNESIQRVATVQDKFTTRQDTLSIYGSLFFIGIFLGSIFMIATVLIIYYKQITEGYEDKDRFTILQKVGMSKKEVKKTIRSQILLVFFLPLFVAILHTVVAFPLMNKILMGLDLDNTRLFLSLTALVVFLFAIAYGWVYRLTARVYYRLVN